MIASHTPTWLFIDSTSDFGGHEVMLIRFIEELAQQERVAPRVLARRGARLRQQIDRFATAIDFAPAGTSKAARVWKGCSDAAITMRAIRALKPELCIVAEGCLLAQPACATAARLLGVPLVIYTPLLNTSTSMGFRTGPIRDWVVRNGYANLPNAWITITHQQAQSFAAWAGVRRPIFTLSNTVSAAIEAATLSHEPATGALRVVVLGRVEAHQKGLDLLVNYLCDTPALVGQVRVTLVGEGSFRAEIAARLRMSPVLRELLELQPWSDTLETFERHDVVLIPSRFEGVPLVMLEAMAVGMPVVASDMPGTRPYLDSASLFTVGDLQRAFERILALRDEAQRQQTIARNREAFDARASAQVFARAVGTLTDQLSQLDRPV